MAQHNHTGRHGESLGKIYFESKGYAILHINWRHRHWEVDIIASRDNILHFIEVKTRTGKAFGHPEENVTRRKIQYLLNAATEYLYENPGWKRIQFDILAITMLKNEPVEYFLIEDVYV